VSRALHTAFALALLLALAAGCATSLAPTAPPLRVGDVAGEGDEVRRASQRIVLDGLRADAEQQSERARGLYQRALQVDSGNPFAYLALARQSVALGEADLALEYVDRAEDLLAVDAASSPGVAAHLDGLRGAALSLSGDEVQGRELLERAAEEAPDVWGDGRLDADELR
jgi:hypothetical protein